MSDSHAIPFPGRDFDATNPAHVSEWLRALDALRSTSPEKAANSTSEQGTR